MKENNLFFALPSSQLFPMEGLDIKKSLKATILVKLEKARKFVSNNFYDEALSLYNTLVENYPSQPFFYACRSLLKSKIGDDEGAFYDYQVAKRLDMNYHIFLEWVDSTGKMVESEDLKDLIEDPKADEQYFLNRAALYVQHFEYEKAIEDFSTALLLSSKPIIRVTRGAVYMRMLRYDLALIDLNHALLVDDQLVQAYQYRAKLYVAIREYDLADADFCTALTLHDTDANIYEERAQFYELIEKWDLAIEDYSKVIILDPNDFYVYVLRADLYEKTNKLLLALEDYNKAIELNPYYSDLFHYRGNLLKKMGKADEAEQDFLTFAELENEEE